MDLKPDRSVTVKEGVAHAVSERWYARATRCRRHCLSVSTCMRPILHAHLTSQPPPSPPGTIDPDPNSARRRALPLAGQGVCCCCTVPVSSWTRTLMPAVSETREGGGGR